MLSHQNIYANTCQNRAWFTSAEPGFLRRAAAAHDSGNFSPQSRTLLSADECGEICVSGPQVMLGYWRQAEATRDCLIGGRFHTGDLGSMDADGFLYFVERIKEVISVHGYKVYPRNVEDAIRQHPDPIRGQTPKAYVVLAKGTQLSEDRLQAFLTDKLSPREIPRLFEFRGELPKSAAGKILKRSL